MNEATREWWMHMRTPHLTIKAIQSLISPDDRDYRILLLFLLEYPFMQWWFCPQYFLQPIAPTAVLEVEQCPAELNSNANQSAHNPAKGQDQI